MSLVLALAASVTIVLAVHDTGAFEMDGNAEAGNAPTPTHDWSDVYHDRTLPNEPKQAGTNAIAFDSDDILGNGPSLQATIFQGGGSKDPIDINQWAWKDDAGGLPDKDNLLHSFAARYSLDPTLPGGTCPNGTGQVDVNGNPVPGGVPFNPNKRCDVLYFGSDRFDNSGDAQQGFWFFQDEITLDPNKKVGGGFGFSGQHVPGDLLVISDFSNGGTTSTISIYKWQPICTATNKSSNPSVVPAASCADANLQRLATSNAANCATAGAGDAFCGIVNAAVQPAPWDFLDKSNNTSFANGEFYEGGVNLTLLGLSGECFASIGSETRSSTSTTSVLKDFVLGSFARCGSDLITTPKDSAGASIPANGLSIGTGIISVKDSADLSVTGAESWNGTLKFFLCAPSELVNGVCTAGTQIGNVNGIPVSNTTTFPVLSDAATLTRAGNYCWRAVFTSNTNGVPGDDDSSSGECFTVNPVTPTLPTVASGTILIGGSVSDVATLTGTATQPGSPVVQGPQGAAAGGTITFRLFGPSDPTCTGTPVFTSSSTTAVSGDAAYSSGSYTPTQVGTYRWIASYSGDSPNTNSFTALCGAQNEEVIVSPRSPTITTDATADPPTGLTIGSAISDTATLAGATATAGGTITFRLYGPNDALCSGASIFTATVSVNGNGTYGSGNFTPSAAGTYRWIASYSGDASNNAVSGACNDANEASLINPAQPGITTDASADPPTGVPLGTAINDVATLSGIVTPSNGVQGTITFRAYGPHADTTTCTTLAYTSVIGVTGNGNYNSANGNGGVFTPTAVGNYNWIASYTPGTGDVNNQPVAGSCGAANEGSLVFQLQPAIQTAQTFTLRDSATISVTAGAGNLAGSVRFRLFNNPNCSTTAPNQLIYDSNGTFPNGIPVSGGTTQTVQSEVITFTVSQPTLSWLVEYTSTNNGHKNVTSACNVEHSTLSIVNQ